MGVLEMSTIHKKALHLTHVTRRRSFAEEFLKYGALLYGAKKNGFPRQNTIEYMMLFIQATGKVLCIQFKSCHFSHTISLGFE